MDQHTSVVPVDSRVSRRTVLRWIVVGTTSVVAGGLLAACGGSNASGSTSTAKTGAATTASSGSPSVGAQATAAQGSGGELVVATTFTIPSMDPGRANTLTVQMFNHAIYDALITFEGEDLASAKPSLAKSWEASQDGKSYTFTLQSGVKFSTGNPLTAGDLKWTFERLKNLKDIPAFLLDPVSDVQAPTPDTFVVNMPSAFPAIIPILCNPNLGAIDSKTLMANGGDASADAKTKDTAEQYLSAHSLGTGAYTLERYTPNQEVVLARNPNHWRGAASVARVIISNVTEAASQKSQLEGGSVDIATDLSNDQVPSLQGNKDVVVKSSLQAATYWVLMNEDAKLGGPFANPKIQQAVRYALDYDGIMKLVGQGAVRTAGVCPTNFKGAADPAKAFKQDTAKAKSLIADAGVGKVSGAFSFANDGSSGGVSTALLAQKIQSDLNAVGMDISLSGLPSTQALDRYFAGQEQFSVWGYTADYPDATNFLLWAPGRQVALHANWTEDFNADAKALADKARAAETELDDSKRAQMVQAIDETIGSTGPFVPLFQPATPYAYRANVAGVTLSSLWGVDFYAVTKS